MTVSDVLGPSLRRLVAPNPGPMTGAGTNTYLLGEGPFAVVDPGPLSEPHLDAILAWTGGEVDAVLVTHAHLDHSASAAALARRTGAEVMAFGDAHAGRSDLMERLAGHGDLGGGEGADTAFRADRVLRDGDVIEAGGRRITAFWTPGHMGNHMSFAVGDWLFTGDLVMGWASSLVSPPDGDLTQFMSSLHRLEALKPGLLLPGHGDPVDDPAARIRALAAHRRAREAEVLAVLTRGPANAARIADAVYARDTPRSLLPAAARNVLAHLIDLTARGVAAPEGELTAEVRFILA